MKRRNLAALLAMLMLVSATLTACGGDKTTTTSSDTPSEVVSTTDEDGREMVGNMYVTGLPLVKEQEEFTIFCDDNGLAEDKIMYPILEEQTNVKVNLMLFPNETAKEKKNILLNSGDYPEVFGGWILGEKDIMTTGMVEGIYIPLEEMMAKYSPKMTEILDIPGVRKTMTTTDGHIYTIPYVIGEPLVSFKPFINQVWLDKVGMEMPTTTEELRAVLKAFKTSDANGNGKADEIPFSADNINMHLGTLAGWFGVNASGASGHARYFAMVDGKMDFMANKEGFKEAMKYLNSLYAEGLMDTELFTQDTATWKAKGNKNMYGMSIAYGSGDFAQADPEFDPEVPTRTQFVPLPVLKSEYCDTPIYRRNGHGVTTFRTQAVITDAAKNPETIIRWWDNVFQLENSVQIQAGLIGPRIEKLGEGEYRALDEQTTLTEEEREKYGWGNMFTQAMPKYIPHGFLVLPAEGVKEYREQDIVDALYEPFLEKETVPLAWVTPEQSEKLAIYETDINEYVLKKIAEWVSGTKSIDAEWDAYLAQLDKYGLQDYMKLKIDAVEAMK